MSTTPLCIFFERLNQCIKEVRNNGRVEDLEKPYMMNFLQTSHSTTLIDKLCAGVLSDEKISILKGLTGGDKKEFPSSILNYSSRINYYKLSSLDFTKK
jgi:hypothetical protein